MEELKETKQKRYLRKFREKGGRVITVRLNKDVNAFLTGYISNEYQGSINELINEALANYMGMFNDIEDLNKNEQF